MTLEVVNLGLPKSGTTTLAHALRRAGYVVADHKLRRRNVDDQKLEGAFVAKVLYQGYFETGDPMSLLPKVTAISEMSLLLGKQSIWPQMDLAFLRALRAHHPKVKFLASRRDPHEHSQSILGWANLGLTRLPQGAIPGLPSGFGTTTAERKTWIEGHYLTLQQWFQDDLNYLEFDIADPQAPTKISAFLGRDLPWWGKLNANPLRQSEVAN